MFNFKKPKAVIVVSRMTGQQEQATITVNSFEADKKSLYDALKEAADALQERLVQNNIIALQGLDLTNNTTEKEGD